MMAASKSRIYSAYLIYGCSKQYLLLFRKEGEYALAKRIIDYIISLAVFVKKIILQYSDGLIVITRGVDGEK
jgi:hypothetical protein